MKNSKIKKFFGRTLSVILTVFLLVGAIPIVGVSAAENEVEYKYFLKEDNTVELTLYEGNDKDVTVLIELRARFDEQNNIDWSQRLEQAGCRIIYGF